MFNMMPTILRNFFSKKETRLYPFQIREPFERVRGELYNEIEKCTFCGLCSKKCPAQCISVDRKAATWECDPFVCVYCGVCVDGCPEEALHQKVKYRSPTAKHTLIFMQGEVKKSKKEIKPDEVKSASE